MSISTPSRLPGAEWRETVKKSGTKEFEKAVGLPVLQPTKFVATQEDSMNADVLTTTVADGILVVTLGSAKRIYFDAEMGDVLTAAREGLAAAPASAAASSTAGPPRHSNPHLS